MKMQKMMVLLLVLMVGSLVLVGCGGTDEVKVKATIEKYFNAYKKEDINAVAATLDSDFSYEGVGKSDFLNITAFGFAFADLKDVKIVYNSVTITDNIAVVSYTVTTTSNIKGPNQTNTTRMEFTLVNKDCWLIRNMKEFAK